eukprot:Awhi_evm1s12206
MPNMFQYKNKEGSGCESKLSQFSDHQLLEFFEDMERTKLKNCENNGVVYLPKESHDQSKIYSNEQDNNMLNVMGTFNETTGFQKHFFRDVKMELSEEETINNKSDCSDDLLQVDLSKTIVKKKEHVAATVLTSDSSASIESQNKEIPSHLEEDQNDSNSDKESESEKNKPVAKKSCSNCSCTKTSMWRIGKSKETLCNACGLYERYNHSPRPKKMYSRPLRRRKRRSNLGTSNASINPISKLAGTPDPYTFMTWDFQMNSLTNVTEENTKTISHSSSIPSPPMPINSPPLTHVGQNYNNINPIHDQHNVQPQARYIYSVNSAYNNSATTSNSLVSSNSNTSNSSIGGGSQMDISYIHSQQPQNNMSTNNNIMAHNYLSNHTYNGNVEQSHSRSNLAQMLPQSRDEYHRSFEHKAHPLQKYHSGPIVQNSNTNVSHAPAHVQLARSLSDQSIFVGMESTKVEQADSLGKSLKNEIHRQATQGDSRIFQPAYIANSSFKEESDPLENLIKKSTTLSGRL